MFRFLAKILGFYFYARILRAWSILIWAYRFAANGGIFHGLFCFAVGAFCVILPLFTAFNTPWTYIRNTYEISEILYIAVGMIYIIPLGSLMYILADIFSAGVRSEEANAKHIRWLEEQRDKRK